MKVISVNVGLPRNVLWKGRTITTGIFKEPVEGRIELATLNFEGDRQADLKVHGGKDKAVYAYPAEHYEFWNRELPGVELPWGSFGENLTVEGLLETEVNIGDRMRIGSAELVVTQPRLPCYKLGVKFQRDDMIERFLDSRRTGFYFAVAREGNIGAGDIIEITYRDPNKVAVTDIVRLYLEGDQDWEGVRNASNLEALPDSWRRYFSREVEKASVNT